MLRKASQKKKKEQFQQRIGFSLQQIQEVRFFPWFQDWEWKCEKASEVLCMRWEGLTQLLFCVVLSSAPDPGQTSARISLGPREACLWSLLAVMLPFLPKPACLRNIAKDHSVKMGAPKQERGGPPPRTSGRTLSQSFILKVTGSHLPSPSSLHGWDSRMTNSLSFLYHKTQERH